MGKMSRNKGARFEREIAHLLTDNGWPATRGCQYSGGADSPDVKATTFPFHLECKRVERLELYSAMTQAIGDAQGQKMPAVVSKRNHADILFTCKFKDLLAWLAEQ